MPSTDTLRACHNCLAEAHKRLREVSKALLQLVQDRHLSADRGQVLYNRLLSLGGTLHSAGGMIRHHDIAPQLSLVIDRLQTIREELELLQFDAVGRLVAVARELVRDARGPLTV